MKAKNYFNQVSVLKHLQQNQHRSSRIFNFEGFGGGGWGVHRESEAGDKKKVFMDPVHYRGSMNLVQSQGPWTSGLCFFLTQEHVVCYTAVFSVVTQRSSPQAAAENRTTFIRTLGKTKLFPLARDLTLRCIMFTTQKQNSTHIKYLSSNKHPWPRPIQICTPFPAHQFF